MGPEEKHFTGREVSRLSTYFKLDSRLTELVQQGDRPSEAQASAGGRKEDLEDGGQGKVGQGLKKIAQQAGKGNVRKLGWEVCDKEQRKERKEH